MPAICARCPRAGTNDLTNEVGDPGIDQLFASAHYLRANFYENALDAEKVSHHLGQVERFAAKPERILDA